MGGYQQLNFPSDIASVHFMLNPHAKKISKHLPKDAWNLPPLTFSGASPVEVAFRPWSVRRRTLLETSVLPSAIPGCEKPRSRRQPSSTLGPWKDPMTLRHHWWIVIPMSSRNCWIEVQLKLASTFTLWGIYYAAGDCPHKDASGAWSPARIHQQLLLMPQSQCNASTIDDCCFLSKRVLTKAGRGSLHTINH